MADSVQVKMLQWDESVEDKNKGVLIEREQIKKQKEEKRLAQRAKVLAKMDPELAALNQLWKNDDETEDL